MVRCAADTGRIDQCAKRTGSITGVDSVLSLLGLGDVDQVEHRDLLRQVAARARTAYRR